MKISVIIPLFNSEKYIKSAVESAVKLQEVGEIILVDDGSTDGTKEICEEILSIYSNTKYYFHKEYQNLGAGPTRNLGIKNAQCEYISFLDSDDLYLENRFKVDCELFKNQPNLEFTLNCVKNQVISSSETKYFNDLITIDQSIGKLEFFKSLIGMSKWYGDFHLNGITVKKNFLIRNSIYFSEKLRIHQDTLFLIKLVYYGNFSYSELNNPVSIRIIHESNRITQLYRNPIDKIKNRKMFLGELKNWALANNIKYAENIRLNYILYSLKIDSNKIKYISLFMYYYIIYRVKKLFGWLQL